MFSHENISQNKEIFKYTIDLETDGFEFLDTSPLCQNIKFYYGQNNKKPKSCPQDVKPGKKGKLLAVNQFFMQLS